MASKSDDKPTVAEEITADPTTAEQQRAAVREEYGQYVAIQPIDHDGVRAYNTGDPVPAANVVRWKYLEQGLVSHTESSEAGDALRAATRPPGRG